MSAESPPDRIMTMTREDLEAYARALRNEVEVLTARIASLEEWAPPLPKR
ncbi:hypothetical protein OPIT5_29250 [Opitutaceae bacterium TAV5]|nr:hypothetical protein OPIT5_21870 [Opitutaceae bacterium TAV5]AHF93674.1 hypothetical protein OPIT5_29250 [Opitutaceae bacterium TAV5]